MQKRPFDGSIHLATRCFHRVAHICSNLQDPVERTDRYYLIRFPRSSDSFYADNFYRASLRIRITRSPIEQISLEGTVRVKSQV